MIDSSARQLLKTLIATLMNATGSDGYPILKSKDQLALAHATKQLDVFFQSGNYKS